MIRPPFVRCNILCGIQPRKNHGLYLHDTSDRGRNERSKTQSCKNTFCFLQKVSLFFRLIEFFYGNLKIYFLYLALQGLRILV